MVLSRSAELFLQNQRAMKAQFFEDRTLFPRAGAFLLTARSAEPDAAALRAARELCEAVGDRFDGLAEQFLPLLTAAAALSPEPEEYLLLSGRAYRACRESFLPSPHLVPAALLLAGSPLDRAEYDDAARLARRLFDAMGEEHPFITGYEDLGVCMLFALTRPEPEQAVRTAEECEICLRPYRRMSNRLQAVTHILAVSDDPQAACARVPALAKAGRGRPALPPVGLAALAVCPGEPDELAEEALAAAQTLRREPGLGPLSLSAAERRLWACLLTALARLRSEAGPGARRGLIAAFLTVLGSAAVDSPGVLTT